MLRSDLCTEASLRNSRLATPARERGVGREEGQITARREAYIRRALEAIVPRPAQTIYRYGARVVLQHRPAPK